MSELRLLPAARPAVCIGSGFIALDVIEIVGNAGSEYAATGGSCGNVMTILAWLGWRCFPIGRLGADVAQALIVEDLSSFKVHTEYLLKDRAVETPIVIHRILRSDDKKPSHRFLLVCPECGAWLPRYRPILLSSAALPKGIAAKPKVFYFDRAAPGVLKLARLAKDAGALVLFEPSSIGDEKQFKLALSLCHVLKFSSERLGHVSDLKTAHGPKMVIETLGGAGLHFYWNRTWTQLDAFPVANFKDAAGAGDWCAAGFLHAVGQRGAEAFLERIKPELVHGLRLGQALAAINCQFDGARGTMYELTRRELDKHLSLFPLGAVVNEARGSRVIDRPTAKVCHLCTGRTEKIKPQKARSHFLRS